jgi:CubicO group peptidase (beta-lactamase class C family)
MALELFPDPSLESIAQASGAQVLLVGGGGRARAWFAGATDQDARIEGRELAQGLLPLLYARLPGPDLLDEPLGSRVEEWREDPRGKVTPRQLMWQLSGLEGGPRQVLNPFAVQAQLLSGPDFMRAALDVDQHYPPASRYEPAAANAQLLALFAERVTGKPYANLLEEQLWERFAADDARATLDRRRGAIAAHCCFSATAADWLRVALLLTREGGELLPAGLAGQIARDHPVNPGQGLIWRIVAGATPLLLLRSEGRVLAVAPERDLALFWAGHGELPEAQVLQLLLPGDSASAD